MKWHDSPSIVGHSRALQRLFGFLDNRLAARLAYATDASSERRRQLAYELVRETLQPLVDSVAFDGQSYHVRFKLKYGGRSPWVLAPVVRHAVGENLAQASWLGDFSDGGFTDQSFGAVPSRQLLSVLAAGASWPR
ncbi:MAG: hypothetical protein LBU12_06730 [Deltaproteobacteria bacterium]|nr:hypothetical protein [Deltaproteobacteria bacterium]